MATPPATIYHHTSQADVYTEPAQFSRRQKIRQLRLMAYSSCYMIQLVYHSSYMGCTWIMDRRHVHRETRDAGDPCAPQQTRGI